MKELESIRDFLLLNDRLGTSGMPSAEQFSAISRAGFDTVINLALPTSDYALPNEGELVTAQGMTYIHIPVKFEAPQPADLEKFSRVMQACASQKVFVHCAANKRVSAFIFLHRVLREGADRGQAERDMLRIWNPDPIWRKFIDAQLRER
ncbi:MAG: protein tyrosine phosphatase family protein [Verrucomicrobiota bacterium]